MSRARTSGGALRDGGIAVASYNVRRCTGLDGVRDPGRIRAVLSAIDADVIGLQEVDSESARHDDGTLESLGRALDMRAIAGPAMRRKDCGYGNGLLTRLEVDRVLRHDLSFGDREPRGALEAEVRLGGTRLTVLTTHLGLHRRERRRQREILVRRVAEIRAPVLVVMGDFNEWTPFGPLRRAMRRMLGRTPAPRTFPSQRPLLSLDRIWARPVDRVHRVRALRTPLTRIASDHLPIAAVLEAADGGPSS